MPFSDVLLRRVRDPVWVCAFVALVVRGAASWQGYLCNIVVQHPQLDGMYYVEWANQIAGGDLVGRGGIVGGAPFFLNPLYAYVLAPIAYCLGTALIPGVLVAQALLGAGTTALSAASARRLFGTVGGWTAGLAVALCSALVHLDGHISISGMGAFLMAGAIWSSVPPRAPAAAGEGALADAPGARFGGAHGPVAAGLWLGLGALARPITPLVLPCFLWLQARRAEPGRRVRTAIIVVLVFLAPASLSFARNWQVGGEGVVYTAASGANLWLGNCGPARENGMMSSGGRFRFNPMEMHADVRRHLAPRVGADATWAEISDTLRDDTINEFMARPAEAIGYLFTKARWFLSPREVPSSAALEIDRELAPLLHLAFIPTWLIAVLAAVGLVLHVRRLEVLLGPGAIAIAHVGVLTIVFPLSHYRSPSVPALAVLAGGAVAWGITAYRARRPGAQPRALAGAVAAVGVLSALAWLPPQPSTIRHAGLMTTAICYRDLGQFDLAEDFAQQAIASYAAEFPDAPRLPAPWFTLGFVYFQRDRDLPRAAEAYLRGLETDPYDWQARLTVVECFVHIPEFDRALEQLDKLLELDPEQFYNPAVRARFGEVLTRLNRSREALEHIEFSLRNGRTPMELPRDWAVPAHLRHLLPPR